MRIRANKNNGTYTLTVSRDELSLISLATAHYIPSLSANYDAVSNGKYPSYYSDQMRALPIDEWDVNYHRDMLKSARDIEQRMNDTLFPRRDGV